MPGDGAESANHSTAFKQGTHSVFGGQALSSGDRPCNAYFSAVPTADYPCDCRPQPRLRQPSRRVEKTPMVRSTPVAEGDRAIQTVVLAFAGDPMARWSWPSAAQYLSYMPSLTRAFVGRAFEHGTAHSTDDLPASRFGCPLPMHARLTGEARLSSLCGRSSPQRRVRNLNQFARL